MLKISWRTTSDLSKPQFDKPDAANFTTVEASNGARLEVWFDRLNIRPYANTLLIRVGRGYLRAGDTLTIRLGDRRQGFARFAAADQCREQGRAAYLGRCFRRLRILRTAANSRLSTCRRTGGRAGRRSCRRSRSSASRFGSPSSPRIFGAIRPRTRRPRCVLDRHCRCAACLTGSQIKKGDGPCVIENLVASRRRRSRTERDGRMATCSRGPIRFGS